MVTRRFLNFGIGVAAFTAMAPATSNARIAEPVFKATPVVAQTTVPSAQSYVTLVLQRQSEIAADFYNIPDAAFTSDQERMLAVIEAVLTVAQNNPSALRTIAAEYNRPNPNMATQFRQALSVTEVAMPKAILGNDLATQKFGNWIGETASQLLFEGTNNPATRHRLADIAMFSAYAAPLATQLNSGDIQGQIRNFIADGHIKSISARRTETIKEIVNRADEITQPVLAYLDRSNHLSAELAYNAVSNRNQHPSVAVQARSIVRPLTEYMRRTARREPAQNGGVFSPI